MLSFCGILPLVFCLEHSNAPGHQGYVGDENIFHDPRLDGVLLVNGTHGFDGVPGCVGIHQRLTLTQPPHLPRNNCPGEDRGVGDGPCMWRYHHPAVTGSVHHLLLLLLHTPSLQRASP
uniref:Uncharacterized protein n=1 Tax=Eutreptiella gymnastica TaxID=73025 RepID=A0A7S4CV15_9EUGL